jgi:hypothetical protein
MEFQHVYIAKYNEFDSLHSGSLGVYPILIFLVICALFFSILFSVFQVRACLIMWGCWC